eukprot:scaffold30238_cov129-Isochrysis_galbana.AAC.1
MKKNQARATASSHAHVREGGFYFILDHALPTTAFTAHPGEAPTSRTDTPPPRQRTVPDAEERSKGPPQRGRVHRAIAQAGARDAARCKPIGDVAAAQACRGFERLPLQLTAGPD